MNLKFSIYFLCVCLICGLHGLVVTDDQPLSESHGEFQRTALYQTDEVESVVQTTQQSTPITRLFTTRPPKEIKTKRPALVMPACLGGFHLDPTTNETYCLRDAHGVERLADEVNTCLSELDITKHLDSLDFNLHHFRPIVYSRLNTKMSGVTSVSTKTKTSTGAQSTGFTAIVLPNVKKNVH